MLVAPKYEEFTYNRRVPEQELLHKLLVEHLETFLAQMRTEDHALPKYVEQELREYVDCGILGKGFLRVWCKDCNRSRAVAFSCKGRGFCPSCTARRMDDTSARLVDDVFPPKIPVRQWVLSLPINIRYRLAHDNDLLSDVLAVFLRVVRGWYYKQAKAMGLKNERCGSVTFAQRFGSALNLNPHFHSLFLDGVYSQSSTDSTPIFTPAPPLTNEAVQSIAEKTARRVIRLLEKRGILSGNDEDKLALESPVLAGLASASIQGVAATGEKPGTRIRRVLSDPKEAVQTGNLCFASSGFSLHAATRIAADNREGLENLCRYVSRPPLAAGRLTRISDEALSFKLKNSWDDGTTHLIFSPMELLARLAALVPPPRINLIRYHGILAPNAKFREKIVPAGKNPDGSINTDAPPKKYRLSWAILLARIFRVDATVCHHCGGRMKIIAAITDPASIRQYLEGTGHSAEIPKLAPARAPPQTEFDW